MGIPYKNDNSPNPAQEIATTALRLFSELGQAVVYVRLAPHMYPLVASAIGQEVDFQVLYGTKPLMLYGLTIKCFPLSYEGEEWTEEIWFQCITENLLNQGEVTPDSLAVRIVKTWEGCQNQCEQGFPCPLLTEIGADLNGEVMDACTALRDIETALSIKEDELADAARLFREDMGDEVQSTDGDTTGSS